MKKKLSIILLSIALIGGFICNNAIAGKKNLLMGSTRSASSHYAYFVAAAKVINDNVPEVNVSVVETGATRDNILRMSKKQLDFGLVTTNVLYEAYHKLGMWKKNPQPNLRYLWSYTIAPQNYVIRKDSNIKSIYDLENKKFNPGMRGSASEKTTEAVLKILGIKPDYFRGSTSDAVASIKDKRIVGYAKSGAGNKLDGSSQDIAALVPITVLNFSDEDKEKVLKEAAFLTFVKIPAGSARGVGEYQTYAFVVGTAAPKDFPENLAYKIVKAVCENVEHQAAAFPPLKGFDIAQATIDTAVSPLHVGAIRYFRERGFKIKKEQIPPEMK
jgi:TRAP transporter TAXI family solute receptor